MAYAQELFYRGLPGSALMHPVTRFSCTSGDRHRTGQQCRHDARFPLKQRPEKSLRREYCAFALDIRQQRAHREPQAAHPAVTRATRHVHGQNLVQWAWSPSNRDRVLTYITDARIGLRGNDLQRLQHPNWLNDEVINAYLGLLNREYRQRGVYCFHSFFYTRLTSPSYCFAYVRRWTTRARFTIHRDALLLIPVNIAQRHWVLVAIDANRRELRCYDSMHSQDGWCVLPNLRHWLTDECIDKGVEDPWLLSDSWTLSLAHEHERIPRQTDGGSCGVFSLLFAEALAKNWSPARVPSQGKPAPLPLTSLRFQFAQRDIPELRKRLVMALLRQQSSLDAPEASVDRISR